MENNLVHFIFIYFLIIYLVSAQVPSPLCSQNGSSLRNSFNIPKCSLPPNELASGRVIPGTLPRDRPLPRWTNFSLARKGQEFAKKNYAEALMSAAYGLTLIKSIPDIRDLFMFRNTTVTLGKLLKHKSRTEIHISNWFYYPINDKVFLSTIEDVRQIQLQIAQNAAARGRPLFDPSFNDYTQTDDILWTAFHKDLRESNIPQENREFPELYHLYDNESLPWSQFVQSMSLFGLQGYLLLNPGKFMNDVTEEDLTAYLHLCAIVGYGLGVQDEYNVCLLPDLASTKRYYKELHEKYVIPSLFNISKETKILIEQYIDNFNNYFPGVERRTIVYQFLINGLKIPAKAVKSILTPGQRNGGRFFGPIYKQISRMSFYRTLANFFARTGIIVAAAINYGPDLTNIERPNSVYDCPSVNYIFGRVSAKQKTRTNMCNLWQYIRINRWERM